MTTYYRISDGALRDLSPEQFAGLQANGKADGLRVYVLDTRPTPTATQAVEEGPVVVGPVEAHRTWTLRDKTAAELAADQAATDRAADLDQIRTVLTALKNGTGTAAERLTRLERVVFRLAKDML